MPNDQKQPSNSQKFAAPSSAYPNFKFDLKSLDDLKLSTDLKNAQNLENLFFTLRQRTNLENTGQQTDQDESNQKSIETEPTFSPSVEQSAIEKSFFSSYSLDSFSSVNQLNSTTRNLNKQNTNKVNTKRKRDVRIVEKYVELALGKI